MTDRFAAAWRRLRQAWKARPGLLAFRAIGTLVIVAMLLFWGGAWTPDFLFVALFLLFALYGQAMEYAFRIGPLVLLLIGPFVVLFLSYDALRPLAPFLAPHVHYWPMINFDRWLGHGTVPTVWLQHHLYHGYLTWYDYYFYALYTCHFLIPIVVAILVYKRAPQDYSRYVAAFLLLSYVGFITYIVFPAAPPWMAADLGLIPHVTQIVNNVWLALGVQDFPTLLSKLSPNQVAAVPSLHAAYPMLVILVVRRSFGWRAAAALVWYPLSMWFGIVYMAEHYVFDALVGIAYAIIAYGLTNWLFDRYAARVRRLALRWSTRLRSSRAGTQI